MGLKKSKLKDLNKAKNKTITEIKRIGMNNSNSLAMPSIPFLKLYIMDNIKQIIIKKFGVL